MFKKKGEMSKIKGEMASEKDMDGLRAGKRKKSRRKMKGRG